MKVRGKLLEMKLLKDDKAVSLALAEILMIVVVVIVGALVIAFAYSLVWSETEVSSVNILLEDAKVGSSNITIVHMGGNTIVDAFAPSSTPSYFLNATIFENLEVRINGSIYEGWASLNAGEIAKPDFEVGDELRLGLGWTLSQGDRITIVYVPTGQVVGLGEV